MRNDVMTWKCGLLGGCTPRTIGQRSLSTFAMAAFDCRLCQVFVPRHRAVGLFGPKGVKKRVFIRISDLLDVPVGMNDVFPEFVAKV